MKRQRLYTKRNFIDILERQFQLLHECIAVHYPQCYTNIKSYIHPMPRTKGSKNRVTASTDFDAQIEKL